MKIIEINCRYSNYSYQARYGGQTASATMSSEACVRRLADKLWGQRVRTITLLGMGDDLFIDRWRVEVDEEPAPALQGPGAAASIEEAAVRKSTHICKAVTLLSVICLVLLAACGGGNEEPWLVASDEPAAQCPTDPSTFVGPLPPQCVGLQTEGRKTTLPLQCGDAGECVR